jgi:hypothetical protein
LESRCGGTALAGCSGGGAVEPRRYVIIEVETRTDVQQNKNWGGGKCYVSASWAAERKSSDAVVRRATALPLPRSSPVTT